MQPKRRQDDGWVTGRSLPDLSPASNITRKVNIQSS